jgi:hypothetical protein
MLALATSHLPPTSGTLQEQRERGYPALSVLMAKRIA